MFSKRGAIGRTPGITERKMTSLEGKPNQAYRQLFIMTEELKDRRQMLGCQLVLSLSMLLKLFYSSNGTSKCCSFAFRK